MKRKATIFIILIALIFSTPFNKVKASEHTDETQTIDLLDAYDNPQNYPEIEVSFLTPEEYIDVLKKDLNISDEHKQNLINLAEERMRISAYSTQSTGYLTYYQPVTVTSNYQVRLYFYSYVEFGGVRPTAVYSIEYANIDRGFYNSPKQFSGSLYYKLESSDTLFWDLNGDFYNTGSTTVSYGLTVGLGNGSSTSFGVTNTSNYYAYVHKSGRLYLL